MDFRQLEHVAAVCQAGSFGSAARRLGISQPTLSKSIARLEKTLDLKLFDRSLGSARPTAYGLAVAEHAEELLAGRARLEQRLEQLAKGEAGSLRIGVGPATRVKLLPEVIRQVGAVFPTLQLETRHDDLPLLLRALRIGALDLVFCYFEAPDEMSDFIRIRIHADRRVAVVRPGHPALRKAPLSSGMLLKYPIASVGVVPSFRKWLGAIDERDARNLRAFVSSDYALVKGRALESDFVACGPRFVFENELADGTLVELRLRTDTQYECWMLTTDAKWRSPVVKRIAEFARAAMRPRPANRGPRRQGHA